MKEYAVGADRLLFLRPQEWEDTLAGELREIGNIPVLRLEVLRSIRYLLDRGADRTEHVQLFLGTFAWTRWGQEWRHRLLYWPTGRPDLESGAHPGEQLFLDVYFHCFHCFDCGLDLDGYAVDLLAYPSSTDWRQLNPVIKPLIKRCPRCDGDLRTPGLIDIYHIYDQPKEAQKASGAQVALGLHAQPTLSVQ